MSSAKQIIVTGGAGYAGSMLVAELLRKKYKVRVIDNFMYGVESLLQHVGNKNLEVVKADVRNTASVKPHLKDADTIFHLAAISGFPACADNPSAAQAINVVATRQLVKALSPHQLIIYASTTSFYGDLPGVSDETTQPKPVSLYGKTKYQAEQTIMDHNNAIALRFATLFGVSPRMRTDLLVNDFVRRAIYERYIVLFEAGTKRTFLHLNDAVRAYLMTLDLTKQMANNIYNVGNSKLNFSKLDIAQAISKQTGCAVTRVKVSDFDVRDFETSFAKIQKLGFKPRVSLADGITELAKLYGFYQPYPTFHIV